MTRPSARLRCESLEDRTTPALFVVDTTLDVVDPTDGLTSLREAISLAEAEADPLGSDISFADPLKRATLSLTQVGGTTFGPAAFEITSRVRINGSGQTLIRADGAADFRLFSVAPGGSLALTVVELVNGVADRGGAIYNAGSLGISFSTLAGNTAAGSPDTGGIGYGGAVYSTGPTFNMGSSTVSDNTAGVGGRGGAVYASGASAYWGHVTVADNGGRTEVEFHRGLAPTPPTLALVFTIIARSGEGPVGAGVDANLVVDGMAPGSPMFGGGWGRFNLIRSQSGYPGEIVSTADPLLGPLQDNGGSAEWGYTRTRGIRPGSPAHNVRGAPSRGPAPDQRYLSGDPGPADVGAFEHYPADSAAFPPLPPPPPPPNDDFLLPPPPTATVATGAAAGQPPLVVVYDQSGVELKRFLAYAPGFRGGVNVALVDVTGDGTRDVVTAAGPGGGPHVKVFDGVTFEEVRSFFAFDEQFRGGVRLAADILPTDGRSVIAAGTPVIVVGAGAGGAPHVKVLNGYTGAEVQSFFAYDGAFRGGVNVAVGDVTGDGLADIVVGAGAGGAPHVQVFDLLSAKLEYSFLAYELGFHGGVNVAAGAAGVVTAPGPGGAPHVKLFRLRLASGIDAAGRPNVEFRSVSELFVGDVTDTGGVNVAAGASGSVSPNAFLTQLGSTGALRQLRWTVTLSDPNPTLDTAELPAYFSGGGSVALGDPTFIPARA